MAGVRPCQASPPGLSLSAWIRRLMRNGAREELAKVARKPSYNGDA